MNTTIENTLFLLEQASSLLMNEARKNDDTQESQDILFADNEIRKALNAIKEKIANNKTTTASTKTDVMKVYTDGACSGNPGPGGYGTILLFPDDTEKIISNGFALTTNNRMELIAVIEGIKMAQECGYEKMEVTSDSSYVINAVTKGWLRSWSRNGFAGRANADLWKELEMLIAGKDIQFNWIKGHAGHPMNERCDKLAVAAYKMAYLKEDEGYNK